MTQASLLWLEDDGTLPLPDLARRLPASEQRELTGFAYPGRARDFALSRLLLRKELAARLQQTGSAIRFRRAESGRLLPAEDCGWHFSLSHAPGLIAVIVADAPCGVDIERRRKVPALRIAGRYFAPAEAEWLETLDEANRLPNFFRLWTLKEAAVKALGTGLADNMARLSFSLTEARPRLTTADVALELYQISADPIFVAAAVAAGPEVKWQVRQLRPAEI